jgi:hypothetical protein
VPVFEWVELNAIVEVALGRGEPLVLTSSVEFVAFLALVLRERERVASRVVAR